MAQALCRRGSDLPLRALRLVPRAAGPAPLLATATAMRMLTERRCCFGLLAGLALTPLQPSAPLAAGFHRLLIPCC